MSFELKVYFEETLFILKIRFSCFKIFEFKLKMYLENTSS